MKSQMQINSQLIEMAKYYFLTVSPIGLIKRLKKETAQQVDEEIWLKKNIM